MEIRGGTGATFSTDRGKVTCRLGGHRDVEVNSLTSVRTEGARSQGSKGHPGVTAKFIEHRGPRGEARGNSDPSRRSWRKGLPSVRLLLHVGTGLASRTEHWHCPEPGQREAEDRLRLFSRSS